MTGTYLLAAAAAGGRITVKNDDCRHLGALVGVLRQTGAEVLCGEGCTQLSAKGRRRAVAVMQTAPYPGFPTDLQSPLMALLCRADGRSCICETVFESRFRTVRGLRRMGADIEIRENQAIICGVSRLCGAVAEAPDLRGGAALVIAALQAQGQTVLHGLQYIERGYEDLAGDFRLLGADIKRYR